MISPLAYIHPEAKIGENVEIAPFVFIDKNAVSYTHLWELGRRNGGRFESTLSTARRFYGELFSGGTRRRRFI